MLGTRLLAPLLLSVPRTAARMLLSTSASRSATPGGWQGVSGTAAQNRQALNQDDQGKFGCLMPLDVVHGSNHGPAGHLQLVRHRNLCSASRAG